MRAWDARGRQKRSQIRRERKAGEVWRRQNSRDPYKVVVNISLALAALLLVDEPLCSTCGGTGEERLNQLDGAGRVTGSVLLPCSSCRGPRASR